MKGSSRSVMKEDNPSSGKTRIGTRSAGRRSLSPSKGARLTKTGTRSPRILAPKSPRIISPGSSFGRLRANRARLEKDKVETPRIQKTPDTTSKHVVTPKSDQPVAQASQSSQGSQGSQSAPNTPQGAGIRTRLSTGSIQMNGTMTISSAKEKAEMDQIIKQIVKSDTVAPTTKTPPVSLKKRTSQMALLPHEGLLSDHPPPKRRKIGRNDGSGEDNRNDYFCWLCHKEGSLVCCELCPRVYHTRCLGLSASLPNDWVCPECEKIMRAECVDTRSKSMEMLTIEQTCSLLKYAVERMKHAGSEPFQNPVDLGTVPNYPDYIFHPMDITALEKNIKNKMYGCTEALLADTKWILHNCIIYNGAHNKLTGSAKMIIKICKHEMNEIELCPDCYLNSCMRKNDDWFSETCRVPHTLVWAKLKGYPFWPSKALREVDGQVDVRFFGAHDRSWVPVSQCFLLSKNIPTSLQKGRKNNGLDMAIEELNLHVKKIREKFGGFEYAPFRTPYDKTDSYKPISIKSELESKPNPVRLIQNREVKTSSGSNFSSHKSNILRKSAVAKTASALRNKYNAMVSLKKLDMTPEKVKKKSHLEEGSTSDDLVEKCAVPIQTDDSNDIVVKLDPDALENKELGSKADTGVKESKKESKLGKDNTPEKVIKKSFVSSSLIERLENKLKALDDETVAATDSKEIKAEILDETHLEHVSSDTEKDKLHSKAQVIVKVEVTNDKDDESIFERDLKSEVEHRDSAVIEEVDKIEGNAKNEESSPSDNEITDKNESEKSNAGTEKNDTESKDSYRRKLDVMIKSCKEKLGMDKEDDESAISDDDYEVSSAESDENESQQSDNEEESMDVDNNEEKEKEGSEMEGVGDIPKTDFKGVLDAKSCVTVAETVEPSTSEVMEQQNSDNVTNDEDSTRELENKNGNKTETSENMDMTTSSSKHEPESKFTGVCKESDEANEEVNDLISSDISEDKFDTLTPSAESIHKLKSPEHSKNKQHGSCSTEEITDQPISENEDRLTLSPNSTTASKLSSSLHASVTLVNKMKIMLSKVLDPLSGEMMDKTTTDEDSDADRLVIDLEEESEHNLSKNRTQVIESAEKKQYKHGTMIVSSPSPEKMNLTEEVDKDAKKFPKYSTESRNIEEKTCHSSEHVDGSSQSSEAEESTQSNKRKYRTPSRELEESTQSNERKYRTPSRELEESTQSNQRKYRTPSRELEESTQSNESEDGTQSAEHENRTLSGEEERPESGEKMNMDVEVLENLSSPALNMDSSLPDKNFVRPPPVLNMDSSLPDKNFVRLPPGLTESSVEKPSSSKMAEKFSKKLLETIQTTMDEMCSDVLKEANDMRSADVLSQQLSQARWSFCSELNELKHNFQLTMYEMKSGWETEKEQIIKSLTAKHQTDKEQAVKEAKKKQWCAQCGKEAIFYCCWNTSYCDYPCQQGHWPQHMHTCLQTNKDKTGAVSISQGQGHAVSQSTSSIPVIGASATPQISVPSATPPVEGDHLRRLQENISMALHREEEKRGETRLGVSKKFVPPMSSPVMQNIRQPGLGSTSMMFNMQSPSPAGVMQQIQRTRFIGQQQMAMQVQQRSSLSQSQQGNPRMLFSQPLIQQAIYPLQVQPQQQLGGTILFQNPQQNLMTYGMTRPPY